MARQIRKKSGTGIYFKIVSEVNQWMTLGILSLY